MALLSISAPACGEESTVGSGPSAEEAAPDAVAPAPEAATLFEFEPDARFVASGTEAGASWWLFVKGSPTDQFGEEMCFEVQVEGAVVDSLCTTPELGTSVAPEATVVGRPNASEGEPRFAFGPVGKGVARVVLGLDSGAALDAPLVGEPVTHYVVALPGAVSPDTADAYGAGGEVLARRDFSAGDASSPEWWESCVPSGGGLDCGKGAVVTESCEEGPDGEVECRFSAEPVPPE